MRRLCRLWDFGREEAWTVAFYTYSHGRYEPSVFPNGTFDGTPEEALQMVKDGEHRALLRYLRGHAGDRVPLIRMAAD